MSHSKNSLSDRYFITRSSRRAEDYDEFWIRYKPQRITRKRLKQLSAIFVTANIVAAFVSLLLLSLYGPAGYFTWFVYAWLLLSALVLTFNPLFLGQYLYPTHVELGKEGLRFHWLRYWGHRASPLINWDRISHVTTSDRKIFNSLDIHLEFNVISRGLSFLDRLTFLSLAPAMSWGWLSSDRPMLNLNIDGIASSDDRQRLQLALKKFLPSYRIEPKVADDLNMYIKFESYTDIWLDALSTSKKRSNETDLRSGTVLSNGAYRIQEEIGSGGQATVYRAEMLKPVPGVLSLEGIKRNETLVDMSDLALITPDAAAPAGGPPPTVVLKEFVLPAQAGTNVRKRVLENIQREAGLWRKLRHPNIARLVDFFVEDQRAYLVLEDVRGDNLKELVFQNGSFNQERTVELALQMCDILGYLHRRNPAVVHRDFTPDNLILSESRTGDVVKLIDFNVALQLEAESTRKVAGKHAFIPPEQFRGKAVPQSDIYAMGATLFFMLTGIEPEAISSSSPRSLNQSVSESLDRIVKRLTEPELSLRYQNCSDVKGDLVGLVETGI